MRRRSLISLLAVLAGAIAIPAGAAPKKTQADRKDEQRENQRVDAARKSVRDAEDAVKEAQQAGADATRSVSEARRRHKLAVAELKATRDRQTAAEEESRGVPALVAEVKRHQDDVTRLSEPLLKSLRSTAEYRTAQTEAQAALAELQKIRGTPAANAVDASGLPRGKVLLKQSLRPVELEQSTLTADAATNAAQKRLATAQEKVTEARRQIETAIENSREVKQTAQQLKAAERELNDAERRAEGTQRQVMTAAAKLARAQQDLAQAIAADKADSNSGKKPNKK